MNRADLLFTFTKINLWRQVQFRKIVYIDADVVALRAPDELFALSDSFAAAPDVGWPDIFNTGVMVLSPDMGTYWALSTLANAGDSFDGADQGLLNQYYEHKPWKRLSFKYNSTPSANYQYEPAYRYYKHDISMVHFIGDEKPWRQTRRENAPPSAYQELLSRWWAVYDRHFKVSTYEYAATGQRVSYAVQDEVRSGTQQKGEALSSTGYPVEAAINTTEAPFTDPSERAEDLTQNLVEPVPTIEVRRFSAPHMEWDATRAPPPSASKPEASNFPSQVYTFNTDPKPFQPPSSYPEPPKDMWFEVPKEPPRKADKPPPIFPWEEREVPKPSRTFAEEKLPSPPPEPPQADSPPIAGIDELAVDAKGTSGEAVTPTIQVTEEPWTKFGAANRNAWDDVSGIDSYVRALSSWQKNRGKPGPIATSTGAAKGAEPSIMSPTDEKEPADLIDRVNRRRESLILTDFPSAVERPSLPVTPAPRRRSTFWGEERDAQGELPAAEGVPDQADWVSDLTNSLSLSVIERPLTNYGEQDPSAQLEHLRRSSLMGPGDLKLPQKKVIPMRTMPESAATVVPEATGHPVALPNDNDGPMSIGSKTGGSSAHGLDGAGAGSKVAFAEPNFSGAKADGKAEEGMSPTEHGTRSYGENTAEDEI